MYNLKLLDEYVDKGLLRRAEDEDLVQYNYSEYCNNNGLWDEITMFNRGNIYEKSTGNLIAKAMPKFLNLGQLSEEKQKELMLKPKFNLTEKMDGCLGILYMYKGEIRCNSRGSFDNYVTDKIKQLLPKYVMLKKILEHNTLNVEVISPETKIICNYGDTEELYLITAYSNNPDIGEFSYKELSLMGQVMRMPVVKEYHMSWNQLLNFQKESNWEQEGYVVRFENNERVKIKSEDYLKVAAFKRNLNKHTLWKVWKNDLKQKSEIDHVKEYMLSCPDELYPTATKYLEELKQALEEHKSKVMELVEMLKDKTNKEVGLYFKENKSKYAGAVFSYRNGHNIDSSIIEYIEPKEEFNGEDYV